MELSLEELIKKKKIGPKPRGIGDRIGQKPLVKKQPPPNRANAIKRTPIPIDARSKIISNVRTKIRDARERISARPKADARLKLMKNFKKPNDRNGRNNTAGKFSVKTNKRGQPVSLTTKRKPAYYPRPEESMDYDDYPISLRRTVHNEFAYTPMPEIPSFSRKPSRPASPPTYADPFDCYQVPERRPVDNIEPMHLQRQLRIYNEEAPIRPGILRSPAKANYYSSNDNLSMSMRSRLENTPNMYESEGIFSKLPVDDFPKISRQVTHQPAPQPQQQQQNGFRIVVSNLHHSVTQSDIKELFEDIGVLLESRLVRPGVAEVIYKTLSDAEEAVDCYHNRQLDGQPMKCLLVKPRAPSKPVTAPAIRLGSGSASSKVQLGNSGHKDPVEIDIDALHKVLFRQN